MVHCKRIVLVFVFHWFSICVAWLQTVVWRQYYYLGCLYLHFINVVVSLLSPFHWFSDTWHWQWSCLDLWCVVSPFLWITINTSSCFTITSMPHWQVFLCCYSLNFIPWLIGVIASRITMQLAVAKYKIVCWLCRAFKTLRCFKSLVEILIGFALDTSTILMHYYWLFRSLGWRTIAFHETFVDAHCDDDDLDN